MSFQYTSSHEPRESYSFSLTSDDFKHIRKHFRIPLTYLQALTPVAVLWIFCTTPNLILRGGWIIAILINIAAYIFYRARLSKLFAHLTGAVYQLDVYSSYFTLTADKIFTEKQTTKVSFLDITRVANAGTCLLIKTSSGKYYIKKDVLPQGSLVYATAATLGRKNTSKPMTKRTKNVALIFAILSAAAFAGSIFIYGYILAADNKIYLAFIFMMFIFPAISTIYLLILNFKGYYVTAHLVISFVSAALIFVVVIFTALTRVDYYIDTTKPITYAEECFNIDIPEYELARTYPKNMPLVYWLWDNHNYLTILDLDRNTSYKFTDAVHDNSNWLLNPTESLEDILIYDDYNRYTYEYAEYVMLYNTDTEELNTLPSESGTYHFIAIYYDAELASGTLYIVEYDVYYTK